MTSTGGPEQERLDISVVVPTRNAAKLIDSCLQSVQRNRPAEIIVVDGQSDDDTVARARKYADVVMSDDGRGVSYAREMGAEAARHSHVAFVDVDVELADGTLAGLLEEIVRNSADGVQALLTSVDGGDYWSRALASHHNRGRSRHWFGLSCALVQRDAFLQRGLDHAFRTGEDIEIRHRLQHAKAKVFVAENVAARHRFEPGFRFALNQWLSDGAGLGRMVRKYGWREWSLPFMPAFAAAFGVFRSLGREAVFIPYYILYMVFNYVGICRGLFDRQVVRERRPEGS